MSEVGGWLRMWFVLVAIPIILVGLLVAIPIGIYLYHHLSWTTFDVESHSNN